ncbi:MAG: glycosyltransferase family 2 protein [Nitrospirae bacterium]|nr:glycosyltransferase family 2 protein [Nitrospirota bacterium]
MPDLSICIVNTNNRDLLRDCLKSVYENTQRISFEVILVENASTDGSLEMTKAEYPDVRLIVNKTKLGFSENNNLAMKIAAGRYYVLLNEDTYVKPNALDMMVEFMDKTPDAGACGGTLLNPDGTIQHTGKMRPTMMAAIFVSTGLYRLFPKNPYTREYFFEREGYGDVEEVDQINGACLMVRREVVDQVGLLDERFFMAAQDVDWCLRIKDAGWRIFYIPKAEVVHYRGKSTKGYRMVWIYHKSLFIFYNKHFADKHIFLYNWLVYVGIALRLVIYMLRGSVLRRESIKAEKKK